MTGADRVAHRGTILPGLLTSAGLLFLVALLLLQLVLASPEPIEQLFSLESRDWRVVTFTTFQAAVSTLLSVSAGIVLAWALSHQRRFAGRTVLIALVSSALVLPTLVVVLGLVSVFGRSGWINAASQALTSRDFGSYIYGLSGILVAHVYLNASFSVRALLIRLEGIPSEKRKLAASLGVSAWQRFVLIEWPALRPALPGLVTVIFLLCFTSFAIVLVLGGSPRYNTLEVAIFEAVKLDFDLPRALNLAMLQLLICAVLVLAAGNYRTGSALVAPRSSRFAVAETRGASLVQLTIIGLFSLFFLAPLAAVVVDGSGAEFGRLFSERAFRSSLSTSLLLASLSALLTLVFALALAFAARNFSLSRRMGLARGARLAGKLISFSGTLYLAVPSLVLALGFFLLARQLPGSLSDWAFPAVLLANTLMALPFALAVLAPASEKIARRYDRLVFSLNLSRLTRWQLVEWPVLRHDIGYVLAIAFCLSFGDLGVIALFGSQDFATLPWYLYQKMGSYRTDDAAGIALVMLALTVTIFFLIPRLFSGPEMPSEQTRAET